MDIHCEISLAYDTESQAQKIQKVVAIDDGSFISSTTMNNTLVANINSTSLPSFLHTLDDYLACVTVAENVLKKEPKK